MPDLFRLIDLSESELDRVVKNWFEMLDSQMDVVTLVCGTLFIPSFFPEADLISLCQALEAYHRCFGKELYASKEEYEPIRAEFEKVIPNDIDPDFKRHLQSVIKFGYQLSLRRRLKAMFEMIPDGAKSVIAKRPAIFIDKLVETRNYLTHRADVDQQKLLTEQEIPVAIKGLFSPLEYAVSHSARNRPRQDQ